MDLELIAGNFFLDENLPKEKQWLLKYFATEQQRRFLVYDHFFHRLRDRSPNHFYVNFIDQTGEYCERRPFQKWQKKLNDLQSLADRAIAETDLELLQTLKSGTYCYYAKQTSGRDSCRQT